MKSNKPLRPETLAADRKVLMALRQMHDYAPSNSAHSLGTLEALERQLEEAAEHEINAHNTSRAARDARIAAEQALHAAIMGAKVQVTGQYGPDSDAVQAIGLTKKSKRRQPARKDRLN